MGQRLERVDGEAMLVAGDRLPADRLAQAPDLCRVSRVWYRGGVAVVCALHGLVGSATTPAELFALRCKVG